MHPHWAIYDDPAVLDTVTTPLADGWREVLIAVDGAHCASCVRGIERALSPHARNVQVNLAGRSVSFRFSPVSVTLSRLVHELDHGGFQPRLLAQETDLQLQRGERRKALARLGIAVLCAMQVMMLAWPTYFQEQEIDHGLLQLMRWSQWLLATPAVFYSGWPYLTSAWRQLRSAALGMDVPVALSILLAYGVSAWHTLLGSGHLYFDAATMFVMLLGAGRFLEGRTRALASDRLRALAGRRPLTAQRIRNGGTEQVPIATLRRDDEIRVAPGDAVPVDGVLLDAAAELDESLLTGEARPAAKVQGTPLLAGSINTGASSIDLRATAVGNATRLASIQQLLVDAYRSKPPAQVLADRIAGHFVLAVLMLAGIAGLVWWPTDADRALNAMMAVLIVSCPCALSLAIPAVYAAASNALAKSGVLLANTSAFARIPKLTHVIFDKTGTLTNPDLSVDEVQIVGGVSRERCVAVAAALERNVHHPIGRAIAALNPDLSATQVSHQATGLHGLVDGEQYWLGALEHAPVDLASHPQGGDALTWVGLYRGAEPLALFGIGSRRRPEARDVVKQLQADHLEVFLLTGDAEKPAQRLAAEVGIYELSWRQTPENKLDRLRAVQALHGVAMVVGDGINDAPVLAAADVGVAMAGGSALAQAKADIVLTGNSLDGLLTLRDVARLAARRVHENLAWALGYNVLMLPIAASGALSPWLAALGMSISSLFVVANALRVMPRQTLHQPITAGYSPAA